MVKTDQVLTRFLIRQRLQAKAFLEAFCKVGGTAESCVECRLRDIPVFTAEEIE